MTNKSYLVLVGSLAISCLIFLASLWQRPIHIDDVWLAEYSYWLAKLGYVKSEALRGFLSAENQLFVYHKLFQVQGAWLIKWFGFKPYVLKSLSFLYLIGSLFLLHLLLRKGTAKGFILLLFALYLSFFHTINLGFVFRPELHLVFWGLASYLLLESYLDTNSRIYLVLSALLSGVGIATHLNGMVFTGASVLLLWVYRRWWSGFFFGVVATWGLAFFFLYDVRSWENLQLLYLQLTNWRDVSTGKYGWESLFRVFSEVSRYFHSPPEIVYSCMLLFLMVPMRKYLAATRSRLIYFTALLSLCVAFVTHGHNTNYLMYALPFLLVLATDSFAQLLEENRPRHAWTVVGFFLVFSWGYDISKFWGTKVEKGRIENAELEKIVQLIPEHAHVLSHHTLIFPGIEKLRIQSFINYRDNVEKGILEKNAEALFAEARKYDIEYVVVSKSNKEFFHIDSPSYEGYEALPTPELKKHWIYKKRQEQTKN